MNEKRDIRLQMRMLQKEFFSMPNEVEKETQRIWAQMEQRPEFQKATTILLYMSIAGEVITTEFIKKWATSKRIAIPLVQGETLLLKEYNLNHLCKGYKDILEPTEKAIDISAEEIDLAIVPGVAFTLKGDRLGRGGGFYDRLLPQLCCPKIGICYPFRIVDALPLESWDAPLDGVIY